MEAYDDPVLQLSFESPLARLTLKRGDKLMRSSSHGSCACRCARTIDETNEVARHDPEWRRHGVLRRGDIGAWGALPPLEMWRSWTRARSSRV